MDLIERQAAIDALARTAREKFNLSDEFNHYLAGLTDGETAIRQLPSAQPYTEADIQKMQDLEQAELQKAYECGRASAQPEIIRCKECKHWRSSDHTCHEHSLVSPMMANDFCSRAERREE